MGASHYRCASADISRIGRPHFGVSDFAALYPGYGFFLPDMPGFDPMHRPFYLERRNRHFMRRRYRLLNADPGV